ncbi:MAG: hypothetical protein HYV51_03330 [Parcubacteria group bacterium]|nr:hypothetical protein [Parcubacteria group bacterium]
MKKRVAMAKELIEILSLPMDMGSVTIWHGNCVAEGLNTMEAFVMLAGMLANGPKQVKMSMPVVTENFLHHFNDGRRAMARVTPRSKK